MGFFVVDLAVTKDLQNRCRKYRKLLEMGEEEEVAGVDYRQVYYAY